MRTRKLVFALIFGAVFLSLPPVHARAFPDRDNWNAGGRLAERPFLGVVVRDVPLRFRKRFKLRPNEGALVTHVQEDSPADTAGILVGDILLALNGNPVWGAGDLIRKIRRHHPGDEIVLDILEDGERWQARVTLDCAPKNWQFYFNFPEWRFETREPTAWLGVKLQVLDPDLAKYFHIHPSDGVLIVSVEPESPAERAGLKGGDILTKLAGERVHSPEDVQEVLADFHPGQRIKVSVIRHDREKEIAVRLGRKPGQNHRYFFHFNWPRFYTRPRFRESPKQWLYFQREHLLWWWTVKKNQLRFRFRKLRNEIEWEIQQAEMGVIDRILNEAKRTEQAARNFIFGSG